MSIEMQNPEGVAGKVDAAWNYVEQIGLALSIGDIAHAKQAKVEAARLLYLATNELIDEPERTVVTCVYCGHEYPDGTPTTKAEALTAHVKVCDKHPMKRAIDALAGLVGSRDKAELKGMRDQIHLFLISPSERAPMVDAIDVLLEVLPDADNTQPPTP